MLASQRTELIEKSRSTVFPEPERSSPAHLGELHAATEYRVYIGDLPELRERVVVVLRTSVHSRKAMLSLPQRRHGDES
jgi:hypothetical protein